MFKNKTFPSGDRMLDLHMMMKNIVMSHVVVLKYPHKMVAHFQIYSESFTFSKQLLNIDQFYWQLG